MNQDEFVEQKKEDWNKLTELLDGAKNDGIRNFSAEEVHKLGSLYRRICSDLSYARSRSFNPKLIRFLNQLARRAYGIIYLDKRENRVNPVIFFTRVFPDVFRKNLSYVLLAAILFTVAAVVAFLWDSYQPGFARVVVPGQFLDVWESPKLEDPYGTAAFPVMSIGYLTHNFRVGLVAFVTGIFLGLGTLYHMVANGLIMGALSSLVIRAGHHVHFFSFVLPHVFIELAAVFICAGAGFIIAQAIISPGDLSYRDSLNVNGKQSIQLVLGSLPLFLLAGIVEASFSRLQVPIFYKVLFSVGTLLFLIWYFSFDPDKRLDEKKTKKKPGG